MTISYPNFEGLGDWEPARQICEGIYNWDDLSTNQIDVNKFINSVLKSKRFHNMVGRKIIQTRKKT